MMGRSWVEIDLDVLGNNYYIYKSFIHETQDIMAVVKADAYGHGEVMVAKKLQQLGCRHFAVSNIDEAKVLREIGITGQILILGYTPISFAKELLQYDITQALISDDYAERLKGRGIKAQFAIDTGMNRIGLDADDSENCERIIRNYSSQFSLTGLFTHLCVADTSMGKGYTLEQINKFKTVVERVKDLRLPYIHCMNSAGGLWQEPYGNLDRLGIILYGLKPDYINTLPSGIKPALVWKSVISMIKKFIQVRQLVMEEPIESIKKWMLLLYQRDMQTVIIVCSQIKEKY